MKIRYPGALLEAVAQTLLGLKISGRQCSEVGRRDIFSVFHSYKGSAAAHTVKALLPYRHPLIRPLVLDLKYRHKSRARGDINGEQDEESATGVARYFSELLLDEIVSGLSDRIGSIPFKRPAILIHIPSYTAACGEKTYDQMEIVSRTLARLQKESLASIFFCRTRSVVGIRIRPAEDGRSMHDSRGRAERFDKARETFFINANDDLPKKTSSRVILIDDITTTGATFQTVAALLEEHLEFGKNGGRDDRQNLSCIALCH